MTTRNQSRRKKQAVEQRILEEEAAQGTANPLDLDIAPNVENIPVTTEQESVFDFADDLLAAVIRGQVHLSIIPGAV